MRNSTSLQNAFIVSGLCLGMISIVQGQTQTGGSPAAGQSSPAQCQAQGLNGQCNACVCCCYNGTSAFVEMQPTTDCTCKNNIKASDVKKGVALAIIVLIPTLLASCYFGGLLCISPYRKVRQTYTDHNLSPHSRAMELTCRTR